MESFGKLATFTRLATFSTLVSNIDNFGKILKFLFAGGGDVYTLYVVIELFVIPGGGKLCKVSNVCNFG